MLYKFNFKWVKHDHYDHWFFEDYRHHVAGEVIMKGGEYLARVVTPLHEDEDGNEIDCQELGKFDELEAAKENVRVAACWTTQGEFICN